MVRIYSLMLLVFPFVSLAEEAPKSKESPPFNPPQILVTAGIDANDKLLLVNYRTIYIGFTGESYNSRSLRKVSLDDVKIVNVKGEEISLAAARKQLNERDTPILASAYHTPLPEFYRSMFTPTTLHFLFPAKAPAWDVIQGPGRPIGK